jgi:hypothetical protein
MVLTLGVEFVGVKSSMKRTAIGFLFFLRRVGWGWGVGGFGRQGGARRTYGISLGRRDAVTWFMCVWVWSEDLVCSKEASKYTYVLESMEVHQL